MRDSSYVWRAPSGPLSIRLKLDVVSFLGLAAMQGVKALPRRGLEIGGLLLGRIETRGGSPVLHIDDFETIDSEYRFGPSYRPSEADFCQLDDAIRQHPDAIGFFRTQTRAADLMLEPEDVEVFQRYFLGPDRVFLLIQPVSGRAAFFLAEDGLPVPGEAARGEFPFRAMDIAPEQIEEEAPVHVPALRPGRKMMPALTAAAALLVGAIGGAALVRYAGHRTATSAPPAAAPKQGAPSAGPQQMKLELQKHGTVLQLGWDHDAAPVRNATGASLQIDDGGHHSELKLGPAELQSGLLSYWPESPDVQFQMRLFTKEQQTVTESIRAVNGAEGKAPVESAAAKAAPDVAASAANRRTRSRSIERPEAEEEEAHPSPFTSESLPKNVAAPETVATPSTRKEDAAPSPPPSRPKETAAASASPMAATGTAAPEVSVVAEPVTGSRIGHVMGRIPLVRRLRKHPKEFVAPQPLRQVRPNLSARARGEVKTAVLMDVKVYVTDAGKVEFAELASSGGEHHPDLTDAALTAARRWEFTPARSDGEKVPGEVMLHFRFEPVMTADLKR